MIKDSERCVATIKGARLVDPNFTVDESIYELLKNLTKHKSIERKNRDKARGLLEQLWNMDKENKIARRKGDISYSEGINKKRNRKEKVEINSDY